MRATRAAFAIVVSISASVRIALSLVYEPIMYPDTGPYQALAERILHWNFESYDVGRTPGYPALLALAGGAPAQTWCIQASLGVATAIVLYTLALRNGADPLWAVLIGVVPTASLNVLFFEANLLSESFATFLVALSILLFDAVVRSQRAGVAILLGSCTALLALTRVQYVFVGPLFVVLLVPRLWARHRRTLAAVTLAGAVPLLGWMQFNRVKTGEFGLGGLMGYNLSNISGAVMECARDDFALERDIYVKYRDAQIAAYGDYSCAIFSARPELLRVTGLTDLQLSHRFTAMSLDLFRRYPSVYLARVVRSVVETWKAPIYWRIERIRSHPIAGALRLAWILERPLLVALNLAFLMVCGVMAWRIVRRKLSFEELTGTCGVAASVVLGSCLLCAMVDRDDPGRYAIPTQPLADTVVMLTVASAVRRRPMRAAAEAFDVERRSSIST